MSKDTPPQVGVKHDDGKPRFDLIPAGPLTELADLYRIGAAKYTRYGECTCGAQSVTGTPTQRASAARTTRGNSGSAIPSSPSASVQTGVSGESKTRTRSESFTSEGGMPEPIETGPIAPTESPVRSIGPSSPSHADSAAQPRSGDISTTTTRPEGSEGLFATDATSGSASSSGAAKSGRVEHSPGCAALTVVRDGARNWENGIAFSRLFAAMQRHAWAWWSGQEYDPVDGQHHLASVAWCAFAIMELRTTKPQFDDRPGGKQ